MLEKEFCEDCYYNYVMSYEEKQDYERGRIYLEVGNEGYCHHCGAWEDLVQGMRYVSTSTEDDDSWETDDSFDEDEDEDDDLDDEYESDSEDDWD